MVDLAEAVVLQEVGRIINDIFMKEKFSEADIIKIEMALKKAEQFSDGEIVPIIAKSSDNYLGSRYVFSILLSLIVMGITLIFCSSGLLLLATLVLSLIAGIGLARFFPILCLPFILKQEMKEQTNRRACECFYNYNLGNTRRGSALLIYISCYEHMVLIKTDMRSGEIVTNDELQEICDLIITNIKNNTPSEGLIKAIEKAGEVLRGHFPTESKDTVDELPNKLYFVE